MTASDSVGRQTLGATKRRFLHAAIRVKKTSTLSLKKLVYCKALGALLFRYLAWLPALAGVAGIGQLAGLISAAGA